MIAAPAPFYLDWTFWAFASSAVAILLSQLPPVRLWFRRAHLSLETQDRVHVTHMIGYPNVQMYISLMNNGARAVRVKKIHLELSRHGQGVASLDSMNYHPGESNDRVILMPFTLAAGAEWRYRVNFIEPLVAKDDRELFKMRRALKENISEKFRSSREKDPDRKEYVVADQVALQPILDLFQKKFLWDAGEYEISVRVITGDLRSDVAGHYRFTLYDPDSDELRAYSDDYQYGFGPALDYEKHVGVICQLHPQ